MSFVTTYQHTHLRNPPQSSEWSGYLVVVVATVTKKYSVRLHEIKILIGISIYQYIISKIYTSIKHVNNKVMWLVRGYLPTYSST